MKIPATTRSFEIALNAMTDDEVFAEMAKLERESEKPSNDRVEILARIALIEKVIEQRFPGQLLAPYRDWKKRNS